MRWNKSKWIKDPDTGERRRRANPESEWLSYQDESLRIIDDLTWQRAQARFRDTPKQTARRGRPARYLLSGPLTCADCGASFVMADNRAYMCSSFSNGGAHLCGQKVRVRRDVAESVLLARVKEQLLSDDAAAYVQQRIRKAVDGLDRNRGAAKLEAKLASVDKRIGNLVAAIESMGVSEAQAEQLRRLELEKRDVTEQVAAMSVDREPLANLPDLIPKLMLKWRKLVERIETLPSNPHTRPDDIEAARKHLGALIGKVRFAHEGGAVGIPDPERSRARRSEPSAYKNGSGGSLPTLFCLGYSDGYSLERDTVEDRQRAAVRALTTLGAGCCIACQRS